MSARDFDDLKRHIGHKIVCVGYGFKGQKPFVNVAVECKTCNEVLLDFDKEIRKDEIHYDVFESIDDGTESIESFDDLVEALGFLLTLKENDTKAYFVDKWIGHGLNAQVEAVELEE